LTSGVTGPTRLAAALAAFVLGASLGCGALRGRDLQARPPQGGGEAVALYRVRLAQEGEPDRRFRLWLFAAPPDRLHAEALSPLGTTLWIIDGGSGRLAVTAVRDGVTWAGDETTTAVEALLGLRLSLAELVEALLGAGRPPTSVIQRTGGAGELPDRLIVRAADATLELRLDRRMWAGRPTTDLGTGIVPPGLDVRPLSHLPRDLSRPETDGMPR
jgi:hypothetical protein